MARNAGTIEVGMPVLTLKVRMPPAYGLRMWAMSALLMLAGMVGPHDIEIEIIPKS